jgi:hypothetical protein
LQVIGLDPAGSPDDRVFDLPDANLMPVVDPSGRHILVVDRANHTEGRLIPAVWTLAPGSPGTKLEPVVYQFRPVGHLNAGLERLEPVGEGYFALFSDDGVLEVNGGRICLLSSRGAFGSNAFDRSGDQLALYDSSADKVSVLKFGDCGRS